MIDRISVLKVELERKRLSFVTRTKVTCSKISPIEAKMKLTKMVVIVSIYLTTTNMMLLISFSIASIWGFTASISLYTSALANILLFFTHSTTFVIYLIYDRLFRERLIHISIQNKLFSSLSTL